jgi:adenosylcobinamide-GDP ribazoletransferase
MSIRTLRSAMAFLTVVPVATSEGGPGERLGRAYFPAIGAIVGLIAAGVFALTSWFSTPLLAAVAATASLALLTGALHLDGLADSADGLFGGGNIARRLEVMRDPRLGSFGVVAMALVLLGEVAALGAMPPGRALAALVIAGALSRLAMLAVITLVPYVRASGLGVAAGDSSHRGFDLALGSAFALVACLLDWQRALLALCLVAITAFAVATLARRKLGGATGDIYGATAELCLLAALIAFVVHR